MKLEQIALHNVRRRKTKAIFMLLGLIIGSATVIAIFSVIESMQTALKEQLSELGANLVITADSGSLTFSYGGITIDEMFFDVETLTVADLKRINEIPDRPLIRAVAPKITGTVIANNQRAVLAGSDLQAEFTVKPWLRLEESGQDKFMGGGESSDEKGMDYERLNLERAGGAPKLTNDQVLLGSAAAALLAAGPGETITIDGRYDFEVAAVLEAIGSAEDNQIFVNLEVAQSLLERPSELTVIEIAADYGSGQEAEFLAQLRAALPHARVTGVRQAVMGRHELLSNLSRFGFAASVLFLITGVLVVTLTMSAAVRERTREIGIFRAIGFRGSHIFRIILAEGILISLAGGAIGYPAGLLLSRLGGPLLSGMALQAPWRWEMFLLTLGGTMFIGGLACLYPAGKAASLDPAEALRFI